MRPVQRFHWDEAAYAEAFATLVRCAGERVYERQILRGSLPPILPRRTRSIGVPAAGTSPV